ncbi:histamine H2 receptor-like [Patiria miniata]|uniref:G-protein coupled receptors family 1 profile domain-containing protein n=1 Tax=Patiria miniata TaxID=46514 RepID=A0A913Z7T9_PATMI|nr:histamine H2 receptor-like [Patiria miniata]
MVKYSQVNAPSCYPTTVFVVNSSRGTPGEDAGVNPLFNGRSVPVLVLIGVILFLIIVMTIVGNIFVILAPSVNRRLRNVTGLFIVSLAVADLLLGIVVLPFSAILEVWRCWPFGAVLCNLYVSCDVMFCTASILNLFGISIDRYVAITDPMAYHQRLTRGKALLIINLMWVVSLFISFLPLHLGWNTGDGSVQNYEDPTKCGLESNKMYSLIDGIMLFFLPLTVMCSLYLRILMIARKQARTINSQTCALQPARRVLRENGHTSSRGESSTSASTRAHSSRNHDLAARNHAVVDEHKATKMLATIMGCFVICWVPYFSIFTFIRVFEGAVVPKTLEMVVLWLGYVNSMLNPLLYAALNSEFRRAFRKLLKWTRLSAFRADSNVTQLELSTTSTPRQGTTNMSVRNGSVVPPMYVEVHAPDIIEQGSEVERDY